RILAMSEVLWSPTDKKNYPDFVARVDNFHQRLDALDINYANHLYEVDGGAVTGGYELKSILKNKTIRYTTDGTEPTGTSEVYSGVMPINKDLIIKAAIFDADKKQGATFTQPITSHRALGKKISINVQPSKTYSASGIGGLINGISGSDTRVNDKEWLGFDGEDLEITIDLGEEMQISSIETRFYEAPWMWIYAPKKIAYGFKQNSFISEAEIPESSDTHAK